MASTADNFASDDAIAPICHVNVATLSGEPFFEVTLPVCELGETLKQQVAEAGGPVRDHQILIFNGVEIGDESSLESQGFVEGAVTVTLIIKDPSPAFVWGAFGGTCSLADDGCSLVKGSSPETVGVRAMKALPRNASWKVSISRTGTNASVGVATEDHDLQSASYNFLEGPDHWALCLGESSMCMAVHNKTRMAVYGHVGRAPLPARPCEFRLRILNGTELLVTLPGEDVERVLFSGLPYTKRLFATASAVCANAKLTISLESLT